MNSDESSRSEVTFHEGYADSGDLTIIAKDDIAFRIQKFYLQAASPVFRDMLSLPSAHNEVRLDTSSIHVKLFVDLLQGRIPNFGKLPEPFSVSVVLHLCAQYECISVKHVCLSLLRSYLRTPYSSPHVLEVLCAAVEQQDVDLICDSLAQFEELERIHSVGFDGPEGYALWYESLENRVGANGWDLACLPLEQFQRIPHNVFLAYYRVKTQNLYAQESGNKDLNWTRVGKVVRGVLSWGDPCGVAQKELDFS